MLCRLLAGPMDPSGLSCRRTPATLFRKPHLSGHSQLCRLLGGRAYLARQPLVKLQPQGRHFVRQALRSVACLAADTALQNPFQEAGELSKTQQTLAAVPQAAQYAVAVGATALAAALGFLLGSRSPASPHIARLAGAVVAAAVAVLGLRAVWAQRAGAAAIAFKNALAVRADPATFSRADLQQIGVQWGLDPAKQLVQDLKGAYDTFIQWTMPPPDTPLTGQEADRIRAFKDALSLSDEDAAPVHLDVGRRILRLRYEASSQKSDTQQRKALQRLIYVSALVFGERKAAFLLPWKRICDMSEATVAKAITDNARMLLKSELAKRGNALLADAGLLEYLKALQVKLRAGDDAAADALNGFAQANVEAALTRAMAVMQIRGQKRDVSPAILEMSQIINYSRDIEHLASLPDAPKGITKVTVFGSPLETKRRELADLFRMYVEEAIKDDDEVSEELEDDIADLQLILGMGTKEGDEIVQSVTATAYRNLLRQAVISGELDNAPSKAEVLERLCDQLRFDGEAAAMLHKQLYRQKLDAIMTPKLIPKTSELVPGQEITNDEQAELSRLQKLLCVPVADAKQMNRELLGRIYQKAVEDALAAGVDRFDTEDRARVRAAQRALRLDEAQAKDVLDVVARRAFMGFVTRARTKATGQGQGQHAGAKELKSLVFFSNICVAPLLEDVKEEAKQRASRDIADLMLKAKEDVERKAAAEDSAASADAAAASSTAELAQSVEEKAVAEAAEIMEEAKAAAAAEEASTSGAEAPKSLQKAQDAAAAEAASGQVEGVQMKSQKEVTLAKDLKLDDRLGIYRNFFIYCMTGHVTVLPMGATIVAERDPTEFARLSQLGDILGLSPMDVTRVHSEFAERGFNEQVKQAVAGGQLTAEKRAQLEEVREQLGLSKETSERIIQSISNERISSSLQQLQRMGQLNLENLLAIKESGQSIDGVPLDTRASIYTQEVQKLLTDGTGDFDEETVRHTWPKALGLSEQKVARIMLELASKRTKDMLVQSVSHLRTRRYEDAVKTLNNVISCTKALPLEKALDWRDTAELKDLFSVYLGRQPDSSKQSLLREALGISQADAESLQDLMKAGEFHLEPKQQEQAIF